MLEDDSDNVVETGTADVARAVTVTVLTVQVREKQDDGGDVDGD